MEEAAKAFIQRTKDFSSFALPVWLPSAAVVLDISPARRSLRNVRVLHLEPGKRVAGGSFICAKIITGVLDRHAAGKTLSRCQRNTPYVRFVALSQHLGRHPAAT